MEYEIATGKLVSFWQDPCDKVPHETLLLALCMASEDFATFIQAVKAMIAQNAVWASTPIMGCVVPGAFAFSCVSAPSHAIAD